MQLRIVFLQATIFLPSLETIRLTPSLRDFSDLTPTLLLCGTCIEEARKIGTVLEYRLHQVLLHLYIHIYSIKYMLFYPLLLVWSLAYKYSILSDGVILHIHHPLLLIIKFYI